MRVDKVPLADLIAGRRLTGEELGPRGGARMLGMACNLEKFQDLLKKFGGPFGSCPNHRILG